MNLFIIGCFILYFSVILIPLMFIMNWIANDPNKRQMSNIDKIAAIKQLEFLESTIRNDK